MAGKIKSHAYVSWAKPDFLHTVKTHRNFKSNYQGAMLYAHYELSATELKKEVIKYLKSIQITHPLLERIKDMNDNRFVTIGKYMYILNHGGDIPDNIVPSLIPVLEKIINEEETKTAAAIKLSAIVVEKNGVSKTANTTVKTTITIQDRIRDKAREVAGEMEGWIDDFSVDRKLPVKSVEDFVNLFKTNELKSPHMRYIRDIFDRRSKEISDALDGKDKDLVEGYSHYSKSELKKCDTFNKNMAKACDMMQEVAKVQRVPRKKKLVSTDKIVSKLKYKKDDKTLGLVSLNPSQLVGAKEAWFYSVKTRKLSYYKSVDIDGLAVKGASLLNYSPDSAEKTLRKPVDALAEFKKASKVKLRTFLKDLTTLDTPCTGKLNEHQIILRIDR